MCLKDFIRFNQILLLSIKIETQFYEIQLPLTFSAIKIEFCIC